MNNLKEYSDEINEEVTAVLSRVDLADTRLPHCNRVISWLVWEFTYMRRLFLILALVFTVTMLLQPQSQAGIFIGFPIPFQCQCFTALPTILPVIITDRTDTLTMLDPTGGIGTGHAAIGTTVDFRRKHLVENEPGPFDENGPSFRSGQLNPNSEIWPRSRPSSSMSRRFLQRKEPGRPVIILFRCSPGQVRFMLTKTWAHSYRNHFVTRRSNLQ